MIKSITIKKQENSVLEKCWGTKTLNFTDSINVLFGPNGCGKSVLLNTLSLYTGVSEYGGWSEPIKPIGGQIRINRNYNELRTKKGYLDYAHESAKLGKANLDWDGVAAYFSNITEKSSFQLLGDAMNGMTNEMNLTEAINLNSSKASSGQKTLFHLSKLQNEKVPNLAIEAYKDCNEAWQEYGRLLSNYVKDLPRNGKPSLLLDEPDRSLDFSNQKQFWELFIPIMAKKFQIIVATHSPFVLTKDNINVITQDNYYQKAKDIFYKSFKISTKG